jgi:hypothetical protein
LDGHSARNVIHVDDLKSYLKKLVVGPGKTDNWDEAWARLNGALLEGDDARRDFDAQISFS